MKSITPFLWYDDDAAEVAEFYLDVFDDAEKVSEMTGMDKVLGVTIRIHGQELILFNGGPAQQLDEAFSLMVVVDTQEQVDRYWEALTADGGAPNVCGWLKDKYGLSWQIVPQVMIDALNGSDRDGTNRAMDAMMKMTKFDVDEIRRAYAGE